MMEGRIYEVFRDVGKINISTSAKMEWKMGLGRGVVPKWGSTLLGMTEE